MEDLAYNSALWPTERLGKNRAVGMHEVSTLIAISAMLAALAKKVDSWTTNQTVNVIQAVGSRCNHCKGNHESADCNMGSPFVHLFVSVNDMQYFQRQ